MRIELGYRFGLVGVLALLCATTAFATPLDDYVTMPDPAYSWVLAGSYDMDGYTHYVIDLHSQTWLTPEQVDRTLWQHWLMLYVPDEVEHETGLLVIDSGNNGGSAPTSVDGRGEGLAKIAMDTSSVVARIRMVPNQRLTFAGYRSETEDGLIAYGWRKFMEGGDPIWLMRLPMTKAAMRAMDAVTAFLSTEAGGNHAVDQYVVTGASKRGWTTWTTAAVDPRVVGLAPIVIDLLNMEVSFRHHYDSLGIWSPAVGDYTENGIMDDWFGTPEMDALTDIVEPYSYRDRLTMPKYVVNASGDEFFLPDSSQFYWNRLKGEKSLRYVPNTGHGGFDEQFLDGMTGWYWGLLNDVERPTVTWYKRHDGSLVVDTHGDIPTSATLWKATSTVYRNFMFELSHLLGNDYQSSPLPAQSPGHYVASVAKPAQGWTAFFVELKFATGGPKPFIFTTEVSVVPDVLPYGPQRSQGAAVALLDDAFYAQNVPGGAPVRDAVRAAVSNDGKRMAFWGIHRQTGAAGLFVVNAGRPSSWRRIADDVPNLPAGPLVWLPDDSAVVVGQTKVIVPAPGGKSVFNPYILHSLPATILSMTDAASGNWAVGLANGQVLALPILRNGTEDFARQPVYVTDLGAAGVQIGSARISADGSTLILNDDRSVASEADFGEVYTVRNLAAILAAPKRPGTSISSLAPTALDDENLFPVRTTEHTAYAGFPFLSDDGSLAYWAEDWSGTYRRDMSVNALAGTNFDAMVSYGDGTEADVQLKSTGETDTATTSQILSHVSRGGSRFVYSQPVKVSAQSPDSVLRLFAAPLRTATKSSTLFFDENTYEFYATGATVTRQQFESDGAATVDIYKNVTMVFPAGSDSITIETPVAPEPYSRIPAGVDALPVVRVIGPEATTFAWPSDQAWGVTLIMKYRDAEVDGLDESLLRLYRLDTSAGANVYRAIDAGQVSHDPATNTFTATIYRLGTYAIGGPGFVDDDGDGIPNRWEATYGLDPYAPADYNGDSDGDGLTNLEEYRHNTVPVEEDSDDDGVFDGIEVRAGSNPLNGESVPGRPADGDVDFSGEVNAVDVQLVINGVLGMPTPTRTDISGDNQTDAFDVQLVINAALGFGIISGS